MDCCGCVGFTLLHSDLSLPTSFPSWMFIGVDMESSLASLGTLLTAVVSGESGSVRFLRNLLISMDYLLVMNEDLYDTGSAVVGLYRLFISNFLKYPGGSYRIYSLGGGGGGELKTFGFYVMGVHKQAPSRGQNFF